MTTQATGLRFGQGMHIPAGNARFGCYVSGLKGLIPAMSWVSVATRDHSARWWNISAYSLVNISSKATLTVSGTPSPLVSIAPVW